MNGCGSLRKRWSDESKNIFEYISWGY
ncbi:TPA: hypothetical protein TZY66_001103 [Streptococcus suis]|nr:hypothetical protein [Streptococcus suis]HEL2478913.1 hypothetical protein [Streptococcus suis]